MIPVCTFRNTYAPLTLIILSEVTLTLVHYRRPNLRNMELYTLDFRIYQKEPSTSLVKSPDYDFTTPPEAASSLGPVVLAQLNYGTYLDQKLREKLDEVTPRLSARTFLSSTLDRILGGSRQISKSPSMSTSASLLFRIMTGVRTTVSEISACCTCDIIPRHLSDAS